jgi:hypothetical protein
MKKIDIYTVHLDKHLQTCRTYEYVEYYDIISSGNQKNMNHDFCRFSISSVEGHVAVVCYKQG